MAIARTRILVTAALLLVSANILISYALVLGHFGAPRLGIEGAGIAFATAEAITLSFFSLRAAHQLGAGGSSLFQARTAGGVAAAQLVGLGWPISGVVLIEALRWVGFFLIVGRIGEQPLAAASMVYACYALLLIPVDAFAETAYSLVSNLIGRGEQRRITALIRTVTIRAYLIALPFAVFAVLWPATALSIPRPAPRRSTLRSHRFGWWRC